MAVQALNDGSSLLAGWLNAPFGVPVLAKVNSDGDTLWTRRYEETENERIQALCLASPDGFALALDGTGGPAGPQITVIRTDEFGAALWTHDYCRRDVYYVSGICQTRDGGYVISARVHDPFDYYVLKISSDGDSLWSAVIDGGDFTAYSEAIVADRENGVFVCGWVEVDSSFDTEIFIARIAGNGEARSSRTYGGIGQQAAWGGALTEDGGLMLAGSNNSGNIANPDLFLLRLDSLGDSLWSRNYGTDAVEHGWGGLAINATGEIAMAGGVLGTGGNWDVYVVKTASEASDSPRERSPTPSSLRILSIYPNPLNGVATIEFETSSGDLLTFKLFNVLGEQVANVLQTRFQPGRHRIFIDTARFASGAYICRAESGAFSLALPLYVVR